jgi:N-acyl homoserine lactone hydrolase
LNAVPQAELLVSRNEWRRLSEPHPERDYLFREPIELPGARWMPFDFVATDNPLLAPFGDCYDMMGMAQSGWFLRQVTPSDPCP